MAASNVRIEWNHNGFQNVLQNQQVTALCAELGRKFTAKANANLKTPGYAGVPHGAGRSRWNIYTLSAEAKRDNSKNQTLAKLFG